MRLFVTRGLYQRYRRLPAAFLKGARHSALCKFKVNASRLIMVIVILDGYDPRDAASRCVVLCIKGLL